MLMGSVKGLKKESQAKSLTELNCSSCEFACDSLCDVICDY